MRAKSIDFLRCLKPAYSKRAIKQANPEMVNAPCENLFKAICHFQNWSVTEEKEEFWSVVCEGVLEMREQYIDKEKLTELHKKIQKL